MAKLDSGLRLEEILPDEVRGWYTIDRGRVFDRETLFELIDGSAEVYRSLNVRAVLNRTYQKEGAPNIIVDLFDMGSSADAFGAFHHDIREGEDVGVGSESELQGGSLFMWKDRYFVSAIAFDDDTPTCDALGELGRMVTEAIPGDEGPPDLVGLLPSGGLVKSQIHYFHDQFLFARYLTMPGENPLGLDGDTEGVVARYRTSEDGLEKDVTAALILVRYPSARLAKTAKARLEEAALEAKLKGTMVVEVTGTLLTARSQ